MKNLTAYLKRHRYKIRLFYWLVVALSFVFVVIPIFFFFYLFDEDQVKQLIISQFDSNNYHVEIVGHVAPKFWHGLSLDFQDVEVDTKDYDTLVKIKNMSCQLSWFDLVFARYKVRRISLNDVEINEDTLLKNTNLGNMFNLSNARGNVFSRITTLDMYGIHTVGDHILYKLSEGSLKIRQSGSGAVFELGFKLDDQKIYLLTNGRFSDIAQNKLNFSDFQVRLYNGQNFQLKLNSRASYDLHQEKLELSNVEGSFTLNSNYKGDIKSGYTFFTLARAGTRNFQLNMQYGSELLTHQLKVAINSLMLNNYKDLLVDKVNTAYLIEYNGNKLELNSALTNIKYTESTTTVMAATCDNQLNLILPNFAIGKFSGQLSGNCSYSPQQNLLDFMFGGNLNGAPLKLKMQLYTKGKPHLILSGNMDDLDLSRVKVNKEKFLPLLYDTSNLPFNWLSLINVDGDLIIKHFALDRINLNNLATQFEVVNSTLDLKKIRADVYKGVLNGRAMVKQIGENEFSINTKQVINNVNLEDMFSDLFDVQAISGQANLIADVSVPHMRSYDDFYHNLNGNISIGASRGAFQGVDFNLFVNPDGMNLTSKKSTAFEQLQAIFNFKDGVSKNGQIRFSSKYVIASGGGMIDFDNTQMSYNLSIKSALPRNDEQINSVLIPVTVSGDLFSPKVNIKNIHLYTTDIVTPATTKPVTTKKKRR